MRDRMVHIVREIEDMRERVGRDSWDPCLVWEPDIVGGIAR